MSAVVFEDPAAATAWQTDPVHDTFRERFGPAFARVRVFVNGQLAWESEEFELEADLGIDTVKQYASMILEYLTAPPARISRQ